MVVEALTLIIQRAYTQHRTDNISFKPSPYLSYLPTERESESEGKLFYAKPKDILQCKACISPLKRVWTREKLVQIASGD